MNESFIVCNESYVYCIQRNAKYVSKYSYCVMEYKRIPNYYIVYYWLFAHIGRLFTNLVPTSWMNILASAKVL